MRGIPLTPAGPLWSQREYVACRQMGLEFAAHRHGEVGQVFHYAFPDDLGCVSIIVDPTGLGRHEYIDHAFKRELDWITKASAAMVGR